MQSDTSSHADIVASPYTMNRPKRFICFSLIIELSFLHKLNSSMSSLLGAFDLFNRPLTSILAENLSSKLPPFFLKNRIRNQ